MGLTFKRDDSLERMFDEFAIDPDKDLETSVQEEVNKITEQDHKKEEKDIAE